jgi:hypothetical protein
VLPLIGIGVSSAARHAGHLISFLITLTMMGGMVWFTASQIKRRNDRTCWPKYGPTILVAIAGLFVMADLTRHVLLDNGLTGHYHAWDLEAHALLSKNPTANEAKFSFKGTASHGGLLKHTESDLCVTSELVKSAENPLSNMVTCDDTQDSQLWTFNTTRESSAWVSGGKCLDVGKDSVVVSDDCLTVNLPVGDKSSQQWRFNATSGTVESVTANAFMTEKKTRDSYFEPYNGGWSNMEQYIKPCWTNPNCCSHGIPAAKRNPGTLDQTHEKPRCLSQVGITFTMVFTYTGFVLLAIGTMWNANLVEKLKEVGAKWTELRAGLN